MKRRPISIGRHYLSAPVFAHGAGARLVSGEVIEPLPRSVGNEQGRRPCRWRSRSDKSGQVMPAQVWGRLSMGAVRKMTR